MPGLRERKKAARRRRILNAAEQLFQRRGFAESTVDEIAKLADVAPATVYNYYSTKGDLLLALVAEGDREVIAGSQALIDAPSEDPVQAVCELLQRFVTKSLDQVDRKAWRQVFANSLLQAGSDLSQGMSALNQEFSAQVGRLLERLKLHGRLVEACDTAIAADILFGISHALFMDLICDESMTLASFDSQLRRRISFVLEPLRTGAAGGV